MRKRRPPKESDQKDMEKAYNLILELIKLNSDIEDSLWAGVFASILSNGFYNADFSYAQYCEEMGKIRDFYKHLWEDNANN